MKKLGPEYQVAGKDIVRRIWRAIGVRFRRTRLGFDHYFDLGLYDDRLFSLSWDRWFSRGLKKKLNELLNHQHWHVLANDKVVFHHYLSSLNLPTAQLYAVYHPVGRHAGEPPCLTSSEQVADYLRESAPYPFLVKPVWGAFGRGIYGVRAYDRQADRVQLLPQGSMSVRDFAERVTARPYGNHLIFQELLRTHESLRPVCGESLTSVRLIVLAGSRRPEILEAKWRVPTKGNLTDNFGNGSEGNLLGRVDPVQGTITQVLVGSSGGWKTMTHHPETDVALRDLRLPAWSHLLDLSALASTSFGGLRLQHWDIALTDRGPVFLELNALGNMGLKDLVFPSPSSAPGNSG